MKPTDWPIRVRLGELLRVKHGFAFKGEHFSDFSGEVVLTPGNFSPSGGLVFRPDKDRSYTGAYPPEFLLSEGDLICVMTDLTQEARILGSAALVPGSPACLHNQRLGKIVDLDERRADKRFVYYLMNHRSFREYLKATASGATVKHTSPARIESYEFILRPLQDQHRIASILGAYDSLIEVNQRRIAVLEEMARRLFEEWFVHFRFPWHPAPDAERTLPKGWRSVKLAEAATINGSTIRPGSAPARIGYVDIASVSPGTIDKIEWMSFDTAPGRARRQVKDGSVIWSMVRPNRRSFAMVLDPKPHTIVSTGFAVLDAATVPAAYLYQWVSQDAFVAYLSANATGAAYPAVTAAVFERADIVLPPRDLLNRFSEIAEPQLRLASKLRATNCKLAESRDLVLPRLISGDLPVAAAERELESVA